MNIKKNIIGLFLLIFCLMLKADASKLPNDVWNYVKMFLPQAQQRFDSVITIKNDIAYIPLYPPAGTDVDTIKIEYTYPAGKTLAQMPEVVLLNNGYSLLKVFKDESGNYSLTKKDDLPIKVRLGLMPQDMLTPVGLKIPESLKLTLGDLLIPSKDESALTKLEDSQKSAYSPEVKKNEFIASAEFKDKKIFINPKNSKFLEVYELSSKNPLYELKLSAMPHKIAADSTGNNAVVLYWNKKEIDIINLKDENIVTKIELNNIPTDISMDKKRNMAYISSSEGYSISILDLNSMQLSKVIKLDQKPYKISYCDIDNSISFYDKYSSQTFNVTLNGNDYLVKPLGEVKNVSNILSDVANIYAISRTDASIKIFDKNQEKVFSTIETDKKPTDAIYYNNKIYILCSKEGYLDIYDTAKNKVVSRESLSKDNFYSNVTMIPNEEKILITGSDAKNYLIYDIKEAKLTKKQDAYVNISNIVILDKAQRL